MGNIISKSDHLPLLEAIIPLPSVLYYIEDSCCKDFQRSFYQIFIQLVPGTTLQIVKDTNQQIDTYRDAKYISTTIYLTHSILAK